MLALLHLLPLMVVVALLARGAVRRVAVAVAGVLAAVGGMGDALAEGAALARLAGLYAHRGRSDEAEAASRRALEWRARGQRE